MNPNDPLNQPVNSLVFCSNALSLEKLASYRIALNIWQNELVDLPLNRPLPSVEIVEKFKADNTSTMCSYLLNLVAISIRQIGQELKNWLSAPYDGLYRETFVTGEETWTKYLDQMVWRAKNYALDYFETNQNLIRSDRINEEEKFAIACSYCWENHVKDLWTRVSEGTNEPGGLLASLLHWPLSYWIDRMRSEITFENISDTFDEDDLIENMPLNRWVIEYFWPHLTSDGQFRLVCETVSSKDAISLQFLLSNSNEIILQKILNEKGSDFVEALIVNAEFRHLAVPFWNQVAYRFDSRQFFQLIGGWMLACESGFFTHRLCEDEVTVCMEIWASAPSTLKEHVLNLLSTKSETFESPRIYSDERYRDMRLLKMVLSDASPKQRARMWKENWLKFCTHADHSDMNELIEMCLSDVDERMKFKRNNTMKLDQIQSNCFYLLDVFELDKLNDFLNFCSVDLDTSAELKRRLLRLYFFETYSGCSNVYFRRIDEFVSFIDQSFPNAEQNASFKKEFIKSHTYLDRLIERLYDGEFDLIKNLVAVFLSDEKDVREWKEEFRHYCHHCLSTGSIRKFKSTRWQNFMMWCLGSDERVTEFKRSLNVDDNMFEVFLERCSESRKEARRARKIFDKFLKWCFSSEDEAAFKRKYISANPDDDDVRRLLYGKRRRRE